MAVSGGEPTVQAGFVTQVVAVQSMTEADSLPNLCTLYYGNTGICAPGAVFSVTPL
jgi:hypothetical protein